MPTGQKWKADWTKWEWKNELSCKLCKLCSAHAFATAQTRNVRFDRGRPQTLELRRYSSLDTDDGGGNRRTLPSRSSESILQLSGHQL